MQTLDDLVFVYIETIAKLRPKVCLLENVKGIIQGNAKWYSKEIVRRLNAIGYEVQVFCLNAASMGVPQKRERVFFIGHRKEFKLPKLVLRFKENPILFRDVIVPDNGKPLSGKMLNLWMKKSDGDKSLAKACLLNTGVESYFGTKIQCVNDVCVTLIASSSSPIVHDKKPFELHDNEVKQVGTYPLDYNFKGIEPKYLIGMSVPPVMTAQIANQIWIQWLSKDNSRKTAEK